jgi:4-carboxymuconolactone decarboxylase
MTDDRKQIGRKMLEEMLGAEQASETFEHWRNISPEFDDYVTGFVFGEIWDRPGIDRKTKSLLTIAVTAALGRPRALDLNIRMAQSNGATRQEIAEALLHIAPYAGFPACWEGLAAAAAVFKKDD